MPVPTSEALEWRARAEAAVAEGKWAGVNIICPVHLRPVVTGIGDVPPCGCDVSDEPTVLQRHGLPDEWFVPYSTGGTKP